MLNSLYLVEGPRGTILVYVMKRRGSTDGQGRSKQPQDDVIRNMPELMVMVAGQCRLGNRKDGDEEPQQFSESQRAVQRPVPATKDTTMAGKADQQQYCKDTDETDSHNQELAHE